MTDTAFYAGWREPLIGDYVWYIVGPTWTCWVIVVCDWERVEWSI